VRGPGSQILSWSDFPADCCSRKFVSRVAELTGGKDLQRLGVCARLVANEPILASNVSGPGGKLNLSGTIGAGMRAVSLRSTDVTGVGGFVLPVTGLMSF